MTTIFEEIRSAAEAVADAAQSVDIDDDRLESYADELPLDELEQPERDEALHYFGAGEETVAYIVTLDTVRFGSGYFPWTQPRDGQTDHAMVATALRDRFDREGPFEPEQLTVLTTEGCAEIFAQEIQHEQRRRLMASYAHALNELGEYLIEEYDASYTALVERADGSAAELVELLADMPTFADEVVYRNRDVPFFGRAQRMAADLHLAFEGERWGAFSDIDALTLFADSRVPHVLRLDGVLGYDDDLAARVDGRELLPAGSPQEIEIRACALHAVERLADLLGERLDDGRPPPRLVADLLWHRGEADRYRVRPAHLTRTVAY